MEQGNKRIVNKRVKDLSSLNDALAASVTNQNQEPVNDPVTQQVQEPVTDPVVDQITDPVAEPSQEPIVEQVTEPVIDPVVETPTEPEEIDIFESWDDDSGASDPAPQDPVQENNSEEFVSQVVKDLNLDGINDYESLISKLKENPQEDALEGLPEDLIKAIDLAKQGVDYRSYLQIDNVDYSKVNDVDLVASSVQDYFVEEGQVNEEKLSEYLSGLNDTQIKIEADRIRERLNASKQNAINKLESDQKSARLNAVSDAKNAVNSISDISGFKIKDHQKTAFVDAVQKDTVLKDIMFTGNKIDYTKLANAYFMVNNFDKIVNVLISKNVNLGKKAVIESMSNPEQRVSSTPVAATPDNSVLSQTKNWIGKLKETKR